ncbi:MAG: HepT-like ribonuclease domain-containing protein [Cyanobacteria bacterium P01_H01_bin.121]
MANIKRYTVRGKAEFTNNELIQVWVLYQLQVIGEAARSLSETMRMSHNQVAWQDIIDFRNLLVHEYFRVSLDIVWSIVEQELPTLETQIAVILASL